MPVGGRQPQRLMMKSAQAISQSHDEDDTERYDSAEQVKAVQPRQNIKEAALLRRRKIYPGIHQLLPGGKLSRQKSKTQHAADDKPAFHTLDIVAADGPPRNLDCD